MAAQLKLVSELPREQLNNSITYNLNNSVIIPRSTVFDGSISTSSSLGEENSFGQKAFRDSCSGAQIQMKTAARPNRRTFYISLQYHATPDCYQKLTAYTTDRERSREFQKITELDQLIFDLHRSEGYEQSFIGKICARGQKKHITELVALYHQDTLYLFNEDGSYLDIGMQDTITNPAQARYFSHQGHWGKPIFATANRGVGLRDVAQTRLQGERNE